MKKIFESKYVTVSALTTICGTSYLVRNTNTWIPTSRTFKTEARAMRYAEKLVKEIGA